MKLKIRRSLALLALVVVVLVLTCPDEADYRRWLTEKHGIACTQPEFECKKNGSPIEWRSKSVRSAGIYMLVKDIYWDSGVPYEVKALGILHTFIDRSEH
ncbi:hypothetical protein SAMN02799630_03382 [Paenibacillus sp. UNCCL117]|uniref:hypothetical protein n=1 Tax=unclassified Paenibacillus TaxID=185978 RepID=UPI000888B118|nr:MULTISPECIES: hypothetical protein [unclassified Paenibacillus]SDE44376.1 hypothetical protein SAMN04488602_12854 [Paenibacillus sp. cl123]SFW46248.1 hypothetical protein SAMN02799630_03382 [Paenibacillus sp. UNCCL117]